MITKENRIVTRENREKSYEPMPLHHKEIAFADQFRTEYKRHQTADGVV